VDELNAITHSATHAARWRAIALFVLTAACVLAVLLFTNTLLFSIIGAITLAVVTQPLSAWMRQRMSSTLAAVVMVTLISLALCAPMYFLIKHLILQSIHLVRHIQNGDLDDFIQRVALKNPKLGRTLQNAVDELAPGASGKALATWSAPYLARALQGMAKGLADTLLLLFFYFFFVRDERAAVRTLEGLLPMRENEAFDFVRRLREVIQAIFTGRILVGMLQGALAGIAYWLLGVHGFVLWGFVTFLCCLIPAFGAFLAWVPIALYLGLADSWTKALILTIWCCAVVMPLESFLYPIIVGKKTDLHTAVIFVSIFGGLALFGFSGFVVGPVLVASTMLLLEIWKARFAEAPDA
jgi:predicted PurR-regulated permease PerM